VLADRAAGLAGDDDGAAAGQAQVRPGRHVVVGNVEVVGVRAHSGAGHRSDQTADLDPGRQRHAAVPKAEPAAQDHCSRFDPEAGR
jgi:hypothetical protein